MARGDVLRVDLPAPRGRPGHEQIGRRPAVAVQADVPGVWTSTLMVIPLTRRLTALNRSYTIRVEPSQQNGLTQPSVLLVSQLRALDQDRILDTLGQLEQHYLDQLDSEIKDLLGLES